MTGLTLWYAFQSSRVMELHVSLCTVGYILLMSEAIVVLAGESVLTNFLSRRAKDHVHWILQVLGVICNIAGVYFMYEVKKVHFRSIHAILGLASLILMIPLTVLGYPVLVAVKLRKLIRPVIVKFGHNLVGTLCFVLGMASQCYGYKMRWIANASDIPNVQLLTIIATALITVLSVRGSLPTLCVQLRAIFR
ncbi:hypothetical protein WN55_01830 [Dufourea novaeangliae]|uniref:ascorbate ferrireductase (transmembrane) n=2 Tax=Dufourea novaeangliae TaxID=178035 RepID=A0A154PEY3_DUFNO|nr:hypothetical protein WN55_01830 [Dufourea novaeangliae]